MEEYRLVMQYKNPEGRFINNDIYSVQNKIRRFESDNIEIFCH